MDNNKYIQDVYVTTYFTDYSRRMRAASFMSVAQEMATKAADKLGFGYNELSKDNAVWVLSRMHLQFVDVPVWKDELRVSTWHKGVVGPFFLRDFEVIDSQCNLKIRATSSWVVMDVINRCMIATENVKAIDPARGVCTENAIEQPAPKVVIKRSLEPNFVTEHKVVFSDLDFNGHTNNTKYVDWALDCIDSEILMNHGLSEVIVNYNREARFGDIVTLKRFDMDGCYCVEGETDGKQVFAAKFIFAPVGREC